MLPSIIEELKTRQAYGDLLAEQMCERIDAHIRDLEQSKAWVRHNAKAEHDAIDRLLGITPPAEVEEGIEPSGDASTDEVRDSQFGALPEVGHLPDDSRWQ